MAAYNNDAPLSIIGDGKVGQTVFKYLSSRSMSMDCLVTRHSDRTDALSKSLDGRITDSPGGISASTKTILICVPDALIGDAAAGLLRSGLNLDGVLVAHSSGLRTSEELSALNESGAITGSLHPMQSFHSSDMDPKLLQDIGCGIEGDATFTKRAHAFAEAAGWLPLVIRKENKALYHAANVFAGNFLVALATDAAAILEQSAESPAGLNHLLPMMEAVLERLGHTAPATALTGPAVRGDAEAAALHMAALVQTQGDYGQVYAAWTNRILDLTGADEETRHRMMETLRINLDD